MDLFPQNCELWGHTLHPSLLNSLHLAPCLQGLGAPCPLSGPVAFSWLPWPGMVFHGLPRSLLRMRKRNAGKQPCLQDIWWSVYRDLGFPGGTSGKEPPVKAGDVRDTGSTSVSQRSPGEGKGHPCQYSGPENSMDYIVHGVAKSWTRLSNFHFNLMTIICIPVVSWSNDWVTSLSLFHFHALEKEMATHSSVLAWRIPGTGEPGGLLSMGSHRVRHNWSDLAAAAAAAFSL